MVEDLYNTHRIIVNVYVENTVCMRFWVYLLNSIYRSCTSICYSHIRQCCVHHKTSTLMGCVHYEYVYYIYSNCLGGRSFRFETTCLTTTRKRRKKQSALLSFFPACSPSMSTYFYLPSFASQVTHISHGYNVQ